MGRSDLERVRDWAIEKLATGAEPPWSWYRLMQLREATEAILEGMAVTQPMEDLPRSESRSGGGPRLVASGDPQEIARRHPSVRPIPLPM
jgi:hypothetical protein